MRPARGIQSNRLARFACSPCLITWLLLVFSGGLQLAASAADPTSGVQASAAPSNVSRFIVRFRPDSGRLESGAIDARTVEELQRLLGRSLIASAPTAAGDQVIGLTEPVSVAEAKRLVGLLRMRDDVVFAELEGTAAMRKPDSASPIRSGRDNAPPIRRLIVTFADPELGRKSRRNEKPDVEQDRMLSASAGAPLRVSRATVGGAWVVELPSAVDVASAEGTAAKLQSAGVARFAAPDYVLSGALAPNDPSYAVAQWNLFDAGARPYFGINATQAWDITTGSSGNVIAVVDSGILPHPDLVGRVLPGYNFISDPISAGNGTGRGADATDLGNWRTGGLCPAPLDGAYNSDWHGLFVAGIATADSNNGIGMAGLDWNARVLPVRVLGRCGASTVDLLEGMQWAAGLPVPGVPTNPTPARVINVSLGGPGTCTPALQHMVDVTLDTGAFIAISAGNQNAEAGSYFPANCLGPTVVAATDPYGMRASYSNFGARVDISAPGGDRAHYGTGAIFSTWNSGTTSAASPIYGSWDGTSFATPQVAGVASLMLTVNPSLSAARIKQLMAEAASPFAAGSDCAAVLCGAGIVDAKAAVLAAKGGTALPSSVNYQGLWWNAPPNSEPYWGLNLAHQGNRLFATWYTYDVNGKPWWLSMLATRDSSSGETYSGTIYLNTGPPFNAFVGSAMSTAVGSGTLTFSDAKSGTFTYAVNATTQTKAIIRYDLGTGTQPTCTYSATGRDFAAATNYQDLWWAPGATESGWGVNLVHQGDALFVTWYTYGTDRTPLWLSMLAKRVGATNAYSGALYRSSGPRFDAYDPAKALLMQVGTATLSFDDGNNAAFDYTTTGAGGLPAVTQSKRITRFLFAPPGGTVCS